MKNIKDKKIIILICILLIFTISYFIIVKKVSYAFEINDTQESYNNLINTIKECAKVYATNNSDIFQDSEVAYIKVQDLIDAKLIVPLNGETLLNPNNPNNSLNSNVIKIKKENEKIIVEVDN